MAKPSRATQEKRRRERSKKEKQDEKVRDRADRIEQKKLRGESLADGVDPDLIGIYPGPQPIPDEE